MLASVPDCLDHAVGVRKIVQFDKNNLPRPFFIHMIDPPHYPLPSTHELSRHASAHLMEEIVHLWELTIMTPYLNKDNKLQMKLKFEFWNQQVIEAGRKGKRDIFLLLLETCLYEP